MSKHKNKKYRGFSVQDSSVTGDKAVVAAFKQYCEDKKLEEELLGFQDIGIYVGSVFRAIVAEAFAAGVEYRVDLPRENK